MAREDRKAIAKDLADKGMSTRQIAAATGASHQTIGRDLRGPDGPKNGPDGPRESRRSSAKQRRRWVLMKALCALICGKVPQ
jgi:IS30 family transposase